MHDEQDIANRLMESVGQLVDQPSKAVIGLREVVDALAPYPDLADIRARALSLLAQGLLALDDVSGAEQHVMDAMRIARELEDNAGLTELRLLHEQVAAEKDRIRRADIAREQSAHWLDKTLDSLVEEAGSDLALADALLKHAGALRLHGELDRAEASAVRAIQAADAVHPSPAIRESVMARIALAEIRPGDAKTPILEALALADAANETTLIGLVKRAADLTGVEIPLHRGPLAPKVGS